MPVSITLVAFTALLLAPVLAHAQARVLISHAYQLTREPTVESTGQSYEALAGAYVLYEQCGADLGITDAQKAYLTNRFTQTARAYQIAYQDAYVTYVGASPKQALVDDIAASIKQQQQKTVNNMALSIRKRGCQSERFHKVLKYVERLYADDNAAPVEPEFLAPKAKFGKK